jgi:hypothetical protein
MHYETSRNDFKLFKEEFMKWYYKFGLKHIEVLFNHKDADDDEQDCFAFTTFDSGGMVAGVTLIKDWDTTKPTKYLVKKTAFHECMEVFLFHLRHCATNRYVESREISEEFHRVIRTLEDVVYEPTANLDENQEK